MVYPGGTETKIAAMKRKLTDRGVASLKPKPGEARTAFWDAGTAGFGIRVSANSKTWICKYFLNGRQYRMGLGGYPAVRLAEARKEALAVKARVARGENPAAEKQAAKNMPRPDMFATAADTFIEKYARKRGNKSWRETKRLLDKHVVPVWGRRPIREIMRADVVELLDRVEDHSGFYTANRVLAAVRKLFNWLLVERGKLDTTPIVPGMARGKEVKRERTLDDEEIRAMWNTDLGYPFGPFIRVLLATGQRLREVATMRWQDIDLEARVWTLPAEATKPGRKHEVPLSAPALEVLEALPRFPGPYVFSTTAGEKPISGFSRAKRRADQLSGVSDWRFHDLRRTVGTGMARLQVPKEIRGRVLNHAQKRDVTDTYDSYEYLPEKRHALDAWAQNLISIIRPIDDKVVPLRGS